MAEVGSFVDVESAVQHFRTLSGGFFLLSTFSLPRSLSLPLFLPVSL